MIQRNHAGDKPRIASTACVHPSAVVVGNVEIGTCKEIDLLMADRQGIEIECCPECRGVWLDRGELDKIIERTGSQQQILSKNSEAKNDARQSNAKDTHYSNRNDYYHKKKKRKSILSDIFDF